MTTEPEQPTPEDQEAPQRGPQQPPRSRPRPFIGGRPRDPLEDVRSRLTHALTSDRTVQHVVAQDGRTCLTHDRDWLECRTGLHFSGLEPDPAPDQDPPT